MPVLRGSLVYSSANVAHLDLKPDNVVVNRDRQQLAIIYFNISVQVPEQEPWANSFGERKGGYIAPEIEDPAPVYQPIRADLGQQDGCCNNLLAANLQNYQLSIQNLERTDFCTSILHNNHT